MASHSLPTITTVKSSEQLLRELLALRTRIDNLENEVRNLRAAHVDLHANVGKIAVDSSSNILHKADNADQALVRLGMDQSPQVRAKSLTQQTTAPTVNDDANKGFALLSQWINKTTGDIYSLVDPKVGAAVWRKLN